MRFILQPHELEGDSAVEDLRAAVDQLEVAAPPSEDLRAPRSVQRIARRLIKRVLPEVLVDVARRLRDRSRHPRSRVSTEAGKPQHREDGHIDRFCWPTTRDIVRRAIDEEHPVAVIAEYAFFSKCLEDVRAPTLKIIDTHEVFFRNPERFHIQGLDAPFICTPESEIRALARAEVLVAIQKNDAAALREAFPEKRVITVGHTYPRRDPRFRSPEPGRIVYVGSSNAFNVHGLRQFLTLAWPHILSASHDAHFRIIGSSPRFNDMDYTRVTHVGRVSDDQLVEEYRKARVVINPQVAGTGLKIKCVEALCAGCPLVVNGAGADGLEHYAAQAFLLAKDWTEFAQHVLRILRDDHLAQRLQEDAMRVAEELFSPTATFSELAHVLKHSP